MALFQRNPFATKQEQPLFTIGTSKTMLIIGLGNVGKAYDKTRHNLGFVCLDAFAISQEFDPWAEKKDLQCLFTSKTMGDTRVILCKPTTFMNLSGEAAQKVMHFYKIHRDQVLVVHDELDIPFGQIRTRVGGSAAGNNGIKSLITHIGKEFARIRIGIANPEVQGRMEAADYVLAKLTAAEQALLPALTKETTSILTEYIFGSQLPHETRSFIA